MLSAPVHHDDDRIAAPSQGGDLPAHASRVEGADDGIVGQNGKACPFALDEHRTVVPRDRDASTSQPLYARREPGFTEVSRMVVGDGNHVDAGIAKRFESPWIGWYMDVGNIVNYGWPEQWIRILGARILKLDVKEFSRKKRDAEGLWKGFQVGIGDGDCDWPAVRAALTEIGYRGWATAEVGGGGPDRLKDIKARMDGVLGV